MNCVFANMVYGVSLDLNAPERETLNRLDYELAQSIAALSDELEGEDPDAVQEYEGTYGDYSFDPDSTEDDRKLVLRYLTARQSLASWMECKLAILELEYQLSLPGVASEYRPRLIRVSSGDSYQAGSQQEAGTLIFGIGLTSLIEMLLKSPMSAYFVVKGLSSKGGELCSWVTAEV